MDDQRDDALDLIHRYGPEYGGGLANHAPMAVDSLVGLGRSDDIPVWLDWYSRSLDAPARGFGPIPAADWREYLGRHDRAADWVVFFEREIDAAGWLAALQTWAPRLIPGLAAAATHGVLRSAHAVRGLSAADTPSRRRELAEGLGYWAATWQVLPGTPSHAPVRMPSDAIADVPRLHQPGFVIEGMITDGLRQVGDDPAFAGLIDLAAPDQPARFLSDLTRTTARWFLSDRSAPIVFVHTVTAPSALRFLAPYLPDETVEHALRYAWQTCAALYAWYMLEEPSWNPTDEPVHDHADLIERAVAARGPHTIKFVDACLREHGLDPDPVYLYAAAAAAERVGEF